MLFTIKRRYKFPIPAEHLKYWFIGSQLRIHGLDFEVLENEQALQIIPHAEQVTGIKTLPVTSVELEEVGNRTRVTVTSRLRTIDAGGPLLIIIFCAFLFLASFVLLYVGNDPLVTYFMWAACLVILSAFVIRMQLGYFDYVRKIRAYIKSNGDEITKNVRRQLFKHKVK